MKYFVVENNSYGQTQRHLMLSLKEGSFTGFPAEIGNPNYDQFLVQVDLTDEEVHALTPDVWYDFHEGSV